MLPGTADMLTPPAPVSEDRRAHRAPAAASCISPAEPQSVSRWHSRRRAGRLHYQHPHSAPTTPTTTPNFSCCNNTYFRFIYIRPGKAVISPAAQERRPEGSRSRCSLSHHWTCWRWHKEAGRPLLHYMTLSWRNTEPEKGFTICPIKHGTT